MKATKENKAENRCKKIHVIPNNLERYVSFQLRNLRFLDSLQFFGSGSSLDTLASNLKESPHLKQHFSEVWSFNKSEDVNLLCQKGVYPYSHIKKFLKSLKKPAYHPKRPSDMTLLGRTFPQRSMRLHKEYGVRWAVTRWGNIMIFTCIEIFCSWLISLNSSVKYASRIIR